MNSESRRFTLDANLKACIICDYAWNKETPILYRCARCGHGVRLADEDPNAFHAEEFRKHFRRRADEFDSDGKPNHLFHKSRKKIVAGRLKHISIYLQSDFSCLDIGAGGGTYAAAASKRVASIECTELAPNLVAECERLGFSTQQGDFLQLTFDRPYDVVSAWHVLEHVEDVHAFVKKALGLARKHVIIEVPCDRRVPENFDGHYHYFTITSLTLLLHHFRLDLIEPGVQAPAILAVARGAA